MPPHKRRTTCARGRPPAKVSRRTTKTTPGASTKDDLCLQFTRSKGKGLAAREPTPGPSSRDSCWQLVPARGTKVAARAPTPGRSTISYDSTSSCSMSSILNTEAMTSRNEDIKPCNLILHDIIKNKYVYRQVPHSQQQDDPDEDVDDEEDINEDEEIEDGEQTWQSDCSTNELKDLYILENELYTDVVFSVGKNEDLVKCHKLNLAKASSVFHNMFYENKSNSNETTISFENYEVVSFRAMIRFIYSGSINLSDFNYRTVCELLNLVKEFKLSKALQRKIQSYLWENLVLPPDIWAAIEVFSGNNNGPRIFNTAWKVVQLKADEMLDDPSFLNISESTLIMLLKKNYLEKTSEIELFNACKLWVENVLNVEGREINSKNVREKISKFTPYIRFLAMPNNVFSVGPAKVLTKDETLSVFLAKSASNPDALEPGMCKKNKPRNVNDIKSISVIGTPDNQAEPEIGDILPMSVSDIFTGDGLTEYTKKDLLLQVELPTQIKPNGSNDTYEENLTLIIIEDDSRKIIGKSKLVKKVTFNDFVKVTFDPPVSAKRNGTAFSIIVQFHKDGMYPMYCAKCNVKEGSTIKKLGNYTNVCVYSYKTYEFIKQLYSKNYQVKN